MTAFHPFSDLSVAPSELEELRPRLFNNPFCYEPDGLCRLAARQLQATLPATSEGKMYGVMVVEADGVLGYLQAYSGQMDVPSDDFVPPVFDYLAPGGHFKTHEAEISLVNERIAALSHSERCQSARRRLASVRREAEVEIEKKRSIVAAAKLLRDQRRREAFLSEAEKEELTRQSQFLKAELHRTKTAFARQIRDAEEAVEAVEAEITALKLLRKRKSDSLQRWLFAQFVLLNARGEQKSLLDIFRGYYLRNSPARQRAAAVSALRPEIFASQSPDSLLPPSGAGECCEPKLLQYAFSHGFRPVSMAMFWWGRPPKTEIRQHGQFYPACNGKCKPILEWMLQGVDWAGEEAGESSCRQLEILYEDDYLAVVNKPSGMLSVPGRSRRESVYTIMQERWPDAGGPIIVHRLDMATSGLLVVARTKSVHRQLQAQFRARTVRKRYTALLPVSLLGSRIPSSGTISLPLRPDPADRPRQVVDPERGKPAITHYTIKGRVPLPDPRVPEAVCVELRPLTGRTHQLRVHCAHPDGLSAPILGDTLYGTRAARLYLHAGYLEFVHPVSGKTMRMSSPADTEFFSEPSNPIA
ncbi:RluA family pseudouridine synthase [Prevotella dentasini]|uniref:RluA family pseudouridine synthase n=1 Tax=Prevotella dentasini TaxID=589537 RepID=UPI00046A11D9|nr:RluA family pseudouridine synthase [Prevotella dentasini]